ncbi:hypothetical protein [Alteromonas sp. a30]|uniref:hypothetical protein n=1 Tax=Alteromonas sp. a30 TaxID=2730917 RepID=UPI00228155E9|nr:hypothetical protein [Alteromonas sp. a30]MCY7294606.1 hypothetical protein [Alteromonas sp. a30]
MYFTFYIPEILVLVVSALLVMLMLRSSILQVKNAFTAKLTNKHFIAQRLIFKRRTMYDPKTQSVWGNNHIEWLEEARSYQKMRD